MYSKEATEAVQSLSEELSSVKTQISQVCPWSILSVCRAITAFELKLKRKKMTWSTDRYRFRSIGKLIGSVSHDRVAYRYLDAFPNKLKEILGWLRAGLKKKRKPGLFLSYHEFLTGFLYKRSEIFHFSIFFFFFFTSRDICHVCVTGLINWDDFTVIEYPMLDAKLHAGYFKSAYSRSLLALSI